MEEDEEDNGEEDEHYSDADDFDDEVFLDDDEYSYEDDGDGMDAGKVVTFLDHFKNLHGNDSAEVPFHVAPMLMRVDGTTSGERCES